MIIILFFFEPKWSSHFQTKQEGGKTKRQKNVHMNFALNSRFMMLTVGHVFFN